MEIGELITAGVGLVVTVVTGWASHVFTKRKYNTEVDHSVLENLEASLELYKKIVDDNTIRLNHYIQRNSELEEEVRELRKQVLALSMDVSNDLRKKNITPSTVKPVDKLAETKPSRVKTSNAKKNADTKEGK